MWQEDRRSSAGGIVSSRVVAWLLSALTALIGAAGAPGQVQPDEALLLAEFAAPADAVAGSGFLLREGLERDDAGLLAFTSPAHAAVLDEAAATAFSQRLRGVNELTVGGWFQVLRVGEQVLLGRGRLEIGPYGERFFRPDEQFINFCLGTDARGFLMGTINGNGSMPFVHVTINDVPVQTWQQLVVTKDRAGYHSFYQNGVLVHTDRAAASAPSRQPWTETAAGEHEPVRLEMPAGGRTGEVWVVGRALSAAEIAADFASKRQRYGNPAPGKPVGLREMHAHPLADHAFDRKRVRREFLKLLGPFPETKVPLEPQVHSETDLGTCVRRKVSVQVEAEDRMPAYLLIPKRIDGRVPAVICFYGTTSGAGKDTTAGLSGRRPGDPPHPNLSFAVDLAESGIVAFAADYLRDGERIVPGDAPYDTTRFYARHPAWSIHGKDAWDTMRAIDYLQTLDFVDSDRIGMVGHSYGGHSTIFTAAIEPRIRVAVANGPVSAFREHGMHWAVPRGGRNSQSLPALRPYLLDPGSRLPVTFGEVTALIAPRPLWIGQAAGESRPREEENAALVSSVYRRAGAADHVRFMWYAGDHDFPPPARAAMVEWFKRWFGPAERAP